MFVHIPMEVLEEHPWIAVLIGAVGVGLMGFATVEMVQEYARLREQGVPERVGPSTAQVDDRTPRRWVVLEGGSWECANAAQQTRQPPESWLFGRVDTTEVPVWDESRRYLVIVKLDGDVECATRVGSAVEGVLVRRKDHMWGGSVAWQLEELAGPDGTVVLVAGAGPRQAMTFAIFGLVGSGGSLWLALYFARKWRRQVGRRHVRAVNAPLEPR